MHENCSIFNPFMHLRITPPRIFSRRPSGWLVGSVFLVFLALGGRADAALTGTFTVNSTWATGYTATLTVANGGTGDVTGWTGTLTTADALTSWWGVGTTSSASPYALTPAAYNATIPAGGQISFGFNGNTGSPATPSLTINGQGVPINAGSPPPTPNPGGTPSPTPAPTAPGAPGTATISVLTNFTVGGYDVNWAVYSGGTATTYTLLEDGAVYTTGDAPAASSGSQSGTIHVGNRPYAAHVYQIKLTNAVGSTLSATAPYLSDGASPILIGALSSGGASPDAVMQARQLTVPLQAVVSFPLSMIGGTTGTYVVTTNNPGVAGFTLNGSTLNVTGLAPGRASLRITNTAASPNVSRWLGIRVRKADGSLPGMPDYLAVGSVSQDTDTDLAMWRNFGDGTSNTRVDARYIYLNDGPYSPTWTSWGGNPNNWYGETTPPGARCYGYVRESLKLGMIPFFVWYNIDGTGDSFTTDTTNAQNADFMAGYFTDLKRMCDLVNDEAPDETVGIVIEPDFIGYLAQNGVDPTTFPARTDAAYTAGVLAHGVDPEFPNTITGYVQAVNYLFSKNLPHAYFGWEFALWGHPAGGWTRPSGTLGLMHLTDEPIPNDTTGANATRLGIAAGRPAIYDEAVAETNYYLKCGVASYGASFVSVDKYGLDAGAEAGAAANPGNSTWFWSQTLWNNYLTFVQAMHDTSKLPVTLWQLPVGHINASSLVNPQGGLFANLANTYQHYEDSAPAFFYGDTFSPGMGNRFDYFSGATNGADADPLANLTTNGATITWGSGMQRAADAGVRVALFGAGVGDSTAGTGNPPTDGGWWITATQNYYLQGPVALTATATPTHPSFFSGETALSNGVYYLSLPTGNPFGYYAYLSDPRYLYHFDLGYEYLFDAADEKAGVYFYDFKSQGFFYTSPSFPFPYLYDFNLNTVLYYYPDPTQAGHYNTNGIRYFYDFAAGQIIAK